MTAMIGRSEVNHVFASAEGERAGSLNGRSAVVIDASYLNKKDVVVGAGPIRIDGSDIVLIGGLFASVVATVTVFSMTYDVVASSKAGGLCLLGTFGLTACLQKR